MARFPTENDLPSTMPNAAAKTGAYTPRLITSPFSGLARAGEELMLQAKQQQQDLDEYELNKRKIEYMRKEAELKQKYEVDPDYQTAPDRMQEELNGFRQSQFGGLAPELSRKYDLWSQEQVVQAYSMQQNDRLQKYRADETGKYIQNNQELEAASARAILKGDLVGAAEIAKMMNTNDSGIAALNPEMRARIAAAQAGARQESIGKMIMDQLPPEQAAKLGVRGAETEAGILQSNFAKRLGGIEGTAKNPLSSASGKYQFTDGTWLESVKKYAPDVARGKTDREILSLKANDDAFKDKMFVAFTEENRAYLAQKLGHDPTDGELYLAHQQGKGGATALLGNPGALAKNLVGLNAVKNNLPESMKDKADTITAAEFASFWMNKAGGNERSINTPYTETGYFPLDYWRDNDPIGFKNAVDGKRRELISQSAEMQKILDAKIKDDLSKVSAGTESVPLSKADFDTAYPFQSEAGATYEEYVDVRKYTETMRDMVTMPPLWQEQTLEAMKPNEASPNYARELKQYNEASAGVAKIREEFMKDPVAYAVASGLAPKEMATIDFTAPSKDVIAKLQARGNLAEELSQTYKVPQRVFTNAEAGLLKSVFESGTTKEASILLANMHVGLNDDQRRALSQELSKKDATMLAVAIAQPVDVANAIIEGNKSKLELDKETNMEIESVLMGTTYDAEMFTGQKEAVTAYYKKLLLDKGGDKKFDSNLFKHAVEKTLGPIVEIDPTFSAGNSKVFSFKRETGEWASAGRLNDIFADLTDDVLLEQNGQMPMAEGLSVSAKELVGEGRIYSAGDGKYGFKFMNAGVLMPVTYRDGVTPYTIDARKLDKVVKKKVEMPQSGKAQVRVTIEQENPLGNKIDLPSEKYGYKLKYEIIP